MIQIYDLVLINSHSLSKLLVVQVKCWRNLSMLHVAVTLAWITASQLSDSLELGAISTTFSAPLGKKSGPCHSLAPAQQLLQTWVTRNWQQYTDTKWTLMEHCHYLEFWDEAQALSANSDFVWYMLCFTCHWSTLTSQSNDYNCNLWRHSFISWAGVERFEPQHARACVRSYIHKYIHKYTSQSFSIIRP